MILSFQPNNGLSGFTFINFAMSAASIAANLGMYFIYRVIQRKFYD